MNYGNGNVWLFKVLKLYVPLTEVAALGLLSPVSVVRDFTLLPLALKTITEEEYSLSLINI